MSARTAQLLLLCIALTACTVGPDYETPEPITPDAWKTAAIEELEQPDSPLETWWLLFDDPNLTGLIDWAIASNRNLRTAVARVEESRALLGVAGGGYRPDVVLDATYSRSQVSESTLPPAIVPPEGIDPQDFFGAGIGMSWEIDVFGRVRRTVDAAQANVEASVEDYRDVLVILLADVASSYVNIRTLQARLAYAEANVESQRETLQLTIDRFSAGLTSARDVAQAESILANSEATIPLLEALLEAELNRLSVLVGDVPGSVDGELEEVADIPHPGDQIAMGLPADLLRRRPDIRRAERQLASQTALIGVAKADLYPSFSLTGSIGLESNDSGALVESESVTWALVPGLRWNIFNGGKIRNRVRAEEARTEQARLAYEQTVLRALEEVESTLVAYEQEKIRRDWLIKATDATLRTVELVHTQYLSGLTDFQTYLDTQRTLINQQDQLAQSEGNVVQALIRLNRALGGGWGLPDEDDAVEDEVLEYSAEPVEIGSQE
jgi:NodT family efflux transporter outer membrane factor (OMF) lipoprotein